MAARFHGQTRKLPLIRLEGPIKGRKEKSGADMTWLKNFQVLKYTFITLNKISFSELLFYVHNINTCTY